MRDSDVIKLSPLSPKITTTRREPKVAERYLSIPEVAERLGTTERFPRRLVEERRIEFKRFGRHVRIGERVLAEYIDSCTVRPVERRRGRTRKGAAQ